jgi:hypothetical protein
VNGELLGSPNNEQNGWTELFEEISVFAKWALSSLLDGCFIALWVGVQWFVNEFVISKLPFTGIDSLVLVFFQVLFSVSTLAPVIIYILQGLQVSRLDCAYPQPLTYTDREAKFPLLLTELEGQIQRR